MSWINKPLSEECELALALRDAGCADKATLGELVAYGMSTSVKRLLLDGVIERIKTDFPRAFGIISNDEEDLRLALGAALKKRQQR